VIALVHTLLKCPAVSLKHCLVLAPLNAVLNWVYEWHKWLDKRNQLKVQYFTVLVVRVQIFSTVSQLYLTQVYSNASQKTKRDTHDFEVLTHLPGPHN